MNNFSFVIILNIIFFLSLLFLQNVYISIIFTCIAMFAFIIIIQQNRISLKFLEIQSPKIVLNDYHYITFIFSLLLLIILEKFIDFNIAVIVVFFLFSYLNHLNSRASIIISIFLLILTAFNANVDKQISENIAYFVYLFLIIGIIWRVVEILFLNHEKIF